MGTKILPLKEMSIDQTYNGDKATYEVPIYQRNYTWERDEISALIQDVYDAFTSPEKKVYFIGTLVSYHKGDQVYEVIDGQQRLTTINLVLSALGVSCQNKLTYRARKKSNDTIKNIPDFSIEEKDYGIVNGYKYAENAINEIVPKAKQDGFKDYFQNSVHLIHYQVPKDIDLNHYFEIMNSRGEQLEKHEIIKALLIEKLNDVDKKKFNRLWGFCSEMNVYIQQKYREEEIFGKSLCGFKVSEFGKLPEVDDKLLEVDDNTGTKKISELINYKIVDKKQGKKDKIDSFQPIMDFPNFLLIVLKLTRIEDAGFNPKSFTLDDKNLIDEFEKVQINEEFAKRFGFNLLKAKYFLDNFIVHHSNEDDTIESNPWKLQCWHKDGDNQYLRNLVDGESNCQHKLVQLLSMFEVSFTARQRKNYLFYILLYLFRSDDKNINISKYCEFVLALADKYFKDVYLMPDKLNQINTPNPGSFDKTILRNNVLDITLNNDNSDFTAIYGNGTVISKGIPLFVFNYLDYKLWEKYADLLRGKYTKKVDEKRLEFFETLGCSDFDLKVFDQFYFSRTRRSLEHYYPQANANGENDAPNQEQINCLGNFAMIGNEANSSGSNWSPKTKLDHYLDASGKIKQVSVASIKFMIMMQKCEDNQSTRATGQEWIFNDIEEHQEKMLGIVLGGRK